MRTPPAKATWLEHADRDTWNRRTGGDHGNPGGLGDMEHPSDILHVTM